MNKISVGEGGGGGGSDGAVVRLLASHRCGPGSIPGPGVTCGLSLLLVLVLNLQVCLGVLEFFSRPSQKPACQNPIRR